MRVTAIAGLRALSTLGLTVRVFPKQMISFWQLLNVAVRTFWDTVAPRDSSIFSSRERQFQGESYRVTIFRCQVVVLTTGTHGRSEWQSEIVSTASINNETAGQLDICGLPSQND